MSPERRSQRTKMAKASFAPFDRLGRSRRRFKPCFCRMATSRLAEMSTARRALFPRVAVATTPPVPPGAFAEERTEPRREHSVDDRSDPPCACVARALASARPRRLLADQFSVSPQPGTISCTRFEMTKTRTACANSHRKVHPNAHAGRVTPNAPGKKATIGALWLFFSHTSRRVQVRARS